MILYLSEWEESVGDDGLRRCGVKFSRYNKIKILILLIIQERVEIMQNSNCFHGMSGSKL